MVKKLMSQNLLEHLCKRTKYLHANCLCNGLVCEQGVSVPKIIPIIFLRFRVPPTF